MYYTCDAILQIRYTVYRLDGEDQSGERRRKKQSTGATVASKFMTQNNLRCPSVIVVPVKRYLVYLLVPPSVVSQRTWYDNNVTYAPSNMHRAISISQESKQQNTGTKLLQMRTQLPPPPAKATHQATKQRHRRSRVSLVLSILPLLYEVFTISSSAFIVC